jgi:hypothetical protein
MHRCGLEILFSSPQLLSVIADGAIIRPDHPTDNSPDRHENTTVARNIPTLLLF